MSPGFIGVGAGQWTIPTTTPTEGAGDYVGLGARWNYAEGIWWINGRPIPPGLTPGGSVEFDGHWFWWEPFTDFESMTAANTSTRYSTGAWLTATIDPPGTTPPGTPPPPYPADYELAPLIEDGPYFFSYAPTGPTDPHPDP
jgi:hypothetical protein